MTARTLSGESQFQWFTEPAAMETFSSDARVRHFAKVFLAKEEGQGEFDETTNNKPLAISTPPSSGDPGGRKKLLGSLLLDCSAHERMQMLNFWIEAFQVRTLYLIT